MTPGCDQSVSAGTDLGHLDPIGVRPVAELDRASDRVAGAWPTTACRAEEGASLVRLLGVVGVDGRADQSDVGVPSGRSSRRTDAVQPARVDPSRHDFRSVEQVQQERLRRRATSKHDGGLAQSTSQAGQRLAPVLPPGDDLGDHRVVVGADHVALGDPGVDADARARTAARSSTTVPGAAREALIGVLGVEAGLDRVADLDRRFADQGLAVGDEQLQLDQVEPGGGLGDRVLDLQPGVHLQEGEGLVVRLVEELDGSGPAVSRGPDEVDGTVRSSRSCSGVSTGEPDSSTSFWLRRWIEQSRTPGAHTVPWLSAMTCTSMWRPPTTSRSRNTSSLPNVRRASA